MNRPRHTAEITSPVVALPRNGESLSALVDGELADAELAALCRDDAPDLMQAWGRYQVIGEVLRHGAGAAGPADAARVAAIMQRVRSEVAHSPAGSATPAVALPQAAVPLPEPVRVRAPAANDEVFRWKMLAGFACLATAVAVVWNVGALGGGAGAGAQLAANTPVPASNTASAAAPGVTSGVAPVAAPSAAPPVLASATDPTLPELGAAPVLVQADQGVILRDARLEELLAAHRQAGGLSALQMPAGFLRSATFDLPNGDR